MGYIVKTKSKIKIKELNNFYDFFNFDTKPPSKYPIKLNIMPGGDDINTTIYNDKLLISFVFNCAKVKTK